MTRPGQPPRARRPRSELFGGRLSARVLWLTVATILLVEVLVLLPNLGRERQSWLWTHVAQAHLAAYAATQTGAGLPGPATSATLLRLADAESITLSAPGQPPLAMPPSPPFPPDQTIDLAHESLLTSTWRAALMVAGHGGKGLEVVAPNTLPPGAKLDLILDGDSLSAYLRHFCAHIAALSVLVALATGLLVFAVLDRLLVRPMRLLTASIVGFRQDPEQDGQNALGRLAGRRDDEIGEAARELKALQDEMRAALWRNARLAAVGTSVAKISHDLRNILSSALLVTGRLQEADDPVIQRAARTLIPAVEHAVQMVSRTVDFAREGPPVITRTAVRLRELVDEAAQVLRPDHADTEIDNQVPGNLVLALDRTQIYRVLANLIRNAAEAGAGKITFNVRIASGSTRMMVRDDGPGLPLRVQDNLFKPFTSSGRHGGTGLGLAIARDLIRAHGGELSCAQTGPHGTLFVLELALGEVTPEANRVGFVLPPIEPPAAPAPTPPGLAPESPRAPRRATPPAEPALPPAPPHFAPKSTARRRRTHEEKPLKPLGIEGVPPSRN